LFVTTTTTAVAIHLGVCPFQIEVQHSKKTLKITLTYEPTQVGFSFTWGWRGACNVAFSTNGGKNSIPVAM